MSEDKYLTIRRIADRLDVGESTVWRWVSEKRFPKPMRVSKRFSRWRLSDVQRWEEEQHITPPEQKPSSNDLKKDEPVPCNFRVQPEFRRRLKCFAAARDVDMVDVFTQAVDEYMRKRSG